MKIGEYEYEIIKNFIETHFDKYFKLTYNNSWRIMYRDVEVASYDMSRILIKERDLLLAMVREFKETHRENYRISYDSIR